MKTEIQKLQEWLDVEKKKNGLVDFKFDLKPNVDGKQTLETVAKELNDLIHSQTIYGMVA